MGSAAANVGRVRSSRVIVIVMVAWCAAGISVAGEIADGLIIIPAEPSPMTQPDERSEELIARARALRARHAPELSAECGVLRNDFDDVRTIGVALSMPVADRFRPGVEIWHRAYADPLGDDQELTRCEGRWLWQPDPDVSRWVQAGVARTSATYPTASAGALQPLGGGRRLLVRAGYDQPWDDTASTVRADGRVASIAGELTMPAGRFAVVIAGREGWYTLNAATPAGDSAGRSQEVTLRGEWTLLRRSARNESLGFRDEHEVLDDVPRQDVVLYAAARRHRHLDPSPLIPVIQSSAEQLLGLMAGQDLGMGSNLALDASVGADGERELSFGEVYGIHGRLQVAYDERRRVWIALGRDSEGGSTVPVGITTSVTIGGDWRW